jgi:hypothetical protein
MVTDGGDVGMELGGWSWQTCGFRGSSVENILGKEAVAERREMKKERGKVLACAVK